MYRIMLQILSSPAISHDTKSLTEVNVQSVQKIIQHVSRLKSNNSSDSLPPPPTAPLLLPLPCSIPEFTAILFRPFLGMLSQSPAFFAIYRCCHSLATKKWTILGTGNAYSAGSVFIMQRANSCKGKGLIERVVD